MTDHRGTRRRDTGEGARAPADDLEAAMARLYPDGVPNLYRMLRRNRAVMAGLAGFKQQIEGGRLSQTERGLVALEVARDAECDYCSGALRHYLAHDLAAPTDMICAAPDDLPSDLRARAVVAAARSILALKGKLPRHDIGRFARQGLEAEDLVEIIAVIGEYTIATYAANLDRTRLDPQYRNGGLSPRREE